MFKNLLCYRLTHPLSLDPQAMEEGLQKMLFHPCEASQSSASGWVPPRGKPHGALLEWVAGHGILRFVQENKAVPGAVVKRHLAARCAAIEAQEGRQPGRKESRELREQIVHELLPLAFARQQEILAWLDPTAQRLVLDCSSVAKADALVSALVECWPGFQVAFIDTAWSPQAAMTQWLTGPAEAWPHPFAPGREVELRSADEAKSVVKFTRHHLDDQEMQHHIAQGKAPTQLGMEWDGRVQFVLTEGTQLKKLVFLEGVFDTAEGQAEESGFDSDMAIATGELGPLINDLLAALGGQTGP